jgi:hypothetical protein
VAEDNVDDREILEYVLQAPVSGLMTGVPPSSALRRMMAS